MTSMAVDPTVRALHGFTPPFLPQENKEAEVDNY